MPAAWDDSCTRTRHRIRVQFPMRRTPTPPIPPPTTGFVFNCNTSVMTEAIADNQALI